MRRRYGGTTRRGLLVRRSLARRLDRGSIGGLRQARQRRIRLRGARASWFGWRGRGHFAEDHRAAGGVGVEPDDVAEGAWLFAQVVLAILLPAGRRQHPEGHEAMEQSTHGPVWQRWRKVRLDLLQVHPNRLRSDERDDRIEPGIVECEWHGEFGARLALALGLIRHEVICRR